MRRPMNTMSRPSPKRNMLRIDPKGVITFVYDDRLAGLLSLGEATVKRASHVEPKNTPDGLRWFADLSPVKGPTLGPYTQRNDAIAAEVDWLTLNIIKRN